MGFKRPGTSRELNHGKAPSPTKQAAQARRKTPSVSSPDSSKIFAHHPNSTMASLIRALSLRATSFRPLGLTLRQPVAAATAVPMTMANGAAGAGASMQVGFAQQQQVRGMKVHSAVKKRCEHCKVGFLDLLPLYPFAFFFLSLVEL